VSDGKLVLAIGDVHGHVDRLRALLEQEGIIDWTGKRIRDDVTVVQLGDLGHFGQDTKDKDLQAYQLANDAIDIVLWGNHDRACVDSRHAFAGYSPPFVEACDEMAKLGSAHVLAYAAHGYLLTHAGLHPSALPDEEYTDEVKVAEVLCEGGDTTAVNAVSRSRGGRSMFGGILWRDADEDLDSGFRQVFGHTARYGEVLTYDADEGTSYCVDVGNKTNGKLAGIWLPSERIVQVQL
jgi:hypothetical protein